MNLNDVKYRIDALCQEYIRRRDEIEAFWNDELDKFSDEIINSGVDKNEAARIIVERSILMTEQMK